MPFGLIVRFTLRDGTEGAFDALAAQTLEGIGGEAGTLIYACHAVDGHPRERIFYELYRDESAFEDHERQPHVRHFLAERERYVEKVVVDRLNLLQSKGVPDDGSKA